MLNKFRNLKKFKKLLTDNGYYVGNKFQNGEVNLIKKVIKKFDLFIDCGFHVGDISLSVRKISQEIKIIGFDFNKNFDENLNKKFKLKKIFFKEIGLSNIKIKTNIYNYKNRPELSSLKKRYDYNPKILRTEFKLKKKIDKLDNFQKILKKNKNLFLKIDTDGSEEKILKGAKKILNKHNVSGYFEYSSGFTNFKSKLKNIFDFLYDRNFKIFRLTNSGLINYRYYSHLDENFFQSHYFFTNQDLKKFNFKKKKIISLTSDKFEDYYLFN